MAHVATVSYFLGSAIFGLQKPCGDCSAGRLHRGTSPPGIAPIYLALRRYRKLLRSSPEAAFFRTLLQQKETSHKKYHQGVAESLSRNGSPREI